MTTSSHEKFITYVRTKQFWQSRFRETDPLQPVFIPMDEIRQRFFTDPRHEIELLKQSGRLQVTERTTGNGHTAHLYRATEAGGINPALLIIKPQNLTPLQETIRTNLKLAGLKHDSPSTPYFDTFLYFRDRYIDLFFTVDQFAGRIHTPVSNFHRPYRQNILIDGHETASLDVVTMQPLLLGKILTHAIGENEYSDWINSGDDIYLKIKDKAGLATRDEAKKRFFEILFSKPNRQLSEMFGRADWIEWINAIKSEPVKYNPHTVEKQHSNLAWLLQSTEVKVMRKVWQRLKAENIPFLTVHDEIIIRNQDASRSAEIFDEVLKGEFQYYRLNRKGQPQPAPEAHCPVEVKPFSPESWTQDIEALEEYFTTTTLPPHPFNLTAHETILNVPDFIESHMMVVKASNGKASFRPYLNRLNLLKNKINQTHEKALL
jgi:hypothetical protein